MHCPMLLQSGPTPLKARKPICYVCKRVGDLCKRTSDLSKRVGDLCKRTGDLFKRVGEVAKVSSIKYFDKKTVIGFKKGETIGFQTLKDIRLLIRKTQ